MKRNVMVLVLIAVLVFGLANLSWAQCPEAPNDLGECDTLHVVPLDTVPGYEFPRPVHVSFLVTHDSNTFYNEWEGMWMQDSISGFVVPLTWGSSNPVAACQLLPDSNTADLFGAGFGGSVFRDFGGLENRMRDMYEMGGGQEWDFRIIDVEYSYFRMSLIPTGEPDQGWWEGQRTLLATLTFMVDDTTTICIDSTFWPPTSRLRFARPDAHAYIPRHNMPVCFEVSYPPFEADFTVDKDSGHVPLQVQFTDMSVGNPVAWVWDFGDGDFSLDQNPLHTYYGTGYFDVRLTVWDGRVDSILKEDYIYVQEDAGWAHISGPDGIAVNETLSLYIGAANLSGAAADQCTLRVGIARDLQYVGSHPPGTLVDTTVIWDFGAIPGEWGTQIKLDITYPEESPMYLDSAKMPPAAVALYLAIRWADQLHIIYKQVKFLERLMNWKDILPVETARPQWGPGDNWCAPGLLNIGRGWLEPAPVRVISHFLYKSICVEDYQVNCFDPCSVAPHPLGFTVLWDIPQIQIGSWNSHQLADIHINVPPDQAQACQHTLIWHTMYAFSPDEGLLRRGNNLQVFEHELLFPYDPNQMVVYPQRFTKPGTWLNYYVHFENEGAAPAESVRIVSVVDTNLNDANLMFLDTTVRYDAYDRELVWDFPHMNLQPDSSGYVSYWIMAKDTILSGTEIKGNAMIYFDIMPGVPCSVSLTVDDIVPISQVDSVVQVGVPDTFEVYWSGEDPAPGSSRILIYSLYFSMDGGPDSLWFADTSWFEDDTLETSAVFIGEPGHYYCFYSIAQDRVGWAEEPPGVPDACIPFLRGDANADWLIDIADVVFLINYLYRNGEAPNPIERGDANCDGEVTIGDIVFLINYLYRNGPPPPC